MTPRPEIYSSPLLCTWGSARARTRQVCSSVLLGVITQCEDMKLLSAALHGC